MSAMASSIDASGATVTGRRVMKRDTCTGWILLPEANGSAGSRGVLGAARPWGMPDALRCSGLGEESAAPHTPRDPAEPLGSGEDVRLRYYASQTTSHALRC